MQLRKKWTIELDEPDSNLNSVTYDLGQLSSLTLNLLIWKMGTILWKTAYVRNNLGKSPGT